MKTFFLAMAFGSAFLINGTALKAQQSPTGNKEAQQFIDQYTREYVKLYTQSAEAQWKANIEIIPGDNANSLNAQKADEAMAAFTGSRENIEQARKFLAKKDQLSGKQIKQLEIILYAAANNPQTIAEVVKERIKAENE